MSAPTEPQSVRGAINYAVPNTTGEPLFVNINAGVDGERAKNFEQKYHEVEIENVRGKEDQYSVDKTGFQFFKRTPTVKDFTDDAVVEKTYYPEIEQVLKELTGASRVVIFDHTIRRRRPGEIDDSPQKRQPVPSAHVDQTTKASIARVRKHLPAEEVPELLKKRFQIINVWRPITNIALDWPLALCDYRTVNKEQDALPTALIYPNREPGETFNIQYNPEHRWKYLRGMNTDEGVLIKCFDSVQDGSVAVFTPHTAFQDPSTPHDAPYRESIEVRTLVFYD
ncbi:hypothetical protein BDV98DRAFT_77439 [Pterulicium gracile]|uniref:Methyltransferase n=1 Tax=Pterulicium gracile TaxID=1884261 RepID=A0A5C3QJ32_9AGAR|nr:hypothetical protein BDV98DRAFT_77439 [Pterula gracilis]